MQLGNEEFVLGDVNPATEAGVACHVWNLEAVIALLKLILVQTEFLPFLLTGFALILMTLTVITAAGAVKNGRISFWVRKRFFFPHPREKIEIYRDTSPVQFWLFLGGYWATVILLLSYAFMVMVHLKS